MVTKMKVRACVIAGRTWSEKYNIQADGHAVFVIKIRRALGVVLILATPSARTENPCPRASAGMRRPGFA